MLVQYSGDNMSECFSSKFAKDPGLTLEYPQYNNGLFFSYVQLSFQEIQDLLSTNVLGSDNFSDPSCTVVRLSGALCNAKKSIAKT